MKDEEYVELKLANHIAPTQVRWPADSTAPHWIMLHKAADTARATVKAAWTKLNEIEKSKDLTDQAKRKYRAEHAMAALAALAEDKALADAREAVERMMTRWAEKATAVIKKPEELHEAVLHQEIRQCVRGLDERSKLGWLTKNAGAPLVFSALLGAPSFLSGLTEADVALVKSKAEAALDPKILEARESTGKALADVERGWRAARKLIAEKGNLRQIGDGWEIPRTAA
jgi:hypothetical protein